MFMAKAAFNKEINLFTSKLDFSLSDEQSGVCNFCYIEFCAIQSTLHTAFNLETINLQIYSRFVCGFL